MTDSNKKEYNREQTEQCVEANLYIAESGDTNKALRQIMAHIDTLIDSLLKEREEQIKQVIDEAYKLGKCHRKMLDNRSIVDKEYIDLRIRNEKNEIYGKYGVI